MKRLLLISSLLLPLITLIACSNDEPTAEDRLQSYLDNWESGNYSEMYNMIANQETYASTDFVDRYQKIYGDLKVTDLSIDYQVPETEDESAKSSRSFPIEVSMSTLAGPVTFETDLTVTEQVIEEESKWMIDWNPGFIFPALANGAEVAINTTTPERGEIYDRNQNGLAINATIYSVGVQPSLFENEAEEKQAIADLLAISVESINQSLSADWVGENTFVPLKDVSTNRNEGFIEELFSIPAVVKQDKTGRAYPYGEAAAHLIGYIGQITAEELEEKDDSTYTSHDQIGKRGLEELFEDRLKGETGVAIVAESEDGNTTTIAETAVQHGDDLTITIDATIQEMIYNSFEDDAGTAAAIDPKTGETIALVSSPAFDPNQLTYGISQSEWDTLQNDPQSPITNRFAATFSPGSAFKPVTSAIGLSNGTIQIGEGIEINGKTWAKEDWGNYAVRRVSTSTGPVDLTDALIRSDNIFFAKKAVEMGEKAFVDGLKNMGFDQDFPFAYPMQMSTITSSGTIDNEILLADSGYGQGEIQISALHLATTYTTFINEGDLIQPTLELDEADQVVWQEGLVSSEQAQVVKDALRQVVAASNGTAKEALIDKVRLSGKTGTAELKSAQDEKGGQENGWFVAYPEDESLLISMMIEQVEDKGGSHYTVKKVASIFEQLY